MPQKHEIYGYFFYSFSKVFVEKYVKYILQEMKNGLSLRQQQLHMIMYYIITWAFHKLTCRQNKCTPKNKQYFHFSSPLKDTEIFPELLIWSDSWQLLWSTIDFLLQFIYYIFKYLLNELGCHNKHDTNGWVNLSVISVESFLLYPDEPLM